VSNSEKDPEQKFRDDNPVSPSQIETARMCWRKWGLDKLDKIPRPSNKHAQRGTDAHTVLELWGRDGKIIDLNTDLGKIVSAGLPFLPRPGTYLTEHKFTFRTPRATYRGVQDLKSKPGSLIKSIWDYKTTTDFRWAKTPEILRRDPQANIYAMSEIKAAEAAGETINGIEQNWVYFLADPKKPKSFKVQLHVLRDEHTPVPACGPEVKREHFGVMRFDELYERFDEIEQTSEQILVYRKLHSEGRISGAELPHDATACGAFGGCPYLGKSCKLTVKERITSMEKQQTLADKMEQRKRELAKGAAPAPAPAAKAAAPAAKTTTATTTTTAPASMSDRMRNKLSLVAKGDPITTPKPKAPATNPPEQVKGVDPDAELAQWTPTVRAAGSGTARDRTELAAHAMHGLLASGGYKSHDSSLAETSVRIADAVLAELAHPPRK
jgi:hypothetical protein